jgi:hypothetical protein
MLLICLILFGLMQIFLIYTTQEMTEYFSFRTARTLSVGFNEQLSINEARARSVPVAGAVVEPADLRAPKEKSISGFTTSTYRQNNSVYDYFYRLKRTILHYMEGYRYMECEYWNRECASCGDTAEETYLKTDFKNLSDRVVSNTGFVKYPLRLPFAQAFLPGRQMDLMGNVELKNHAAVYLED